MSGPSEKAVDAAFAEFSRRPLRQLRDATEAAVGAAHDPVLGLDRSVCLRDVVEALRLDGAGRDRRLISQAADNIEREFGS